MYRRFWKRFFDFTLSLMALLVLWPVLLALMLLGWIKMKGNPFFTQLRPGKDEKIFKLIKFRTMTCETDANGDLLPDEQREVVMMRYYSGMSFQEIADQTDVSINTALGRMRYALINLRRMIKEQNIILN